MADRSIRAVAYYRMSTDRQEASIPDQRVTSGSNVTMTCHLCRNATRRHGLTTYRRPKGSSVPAVEVHPCPGCGGRGRVPARVCPGCSGRMRFGNGRDCPCCAGAGRQPAPADLNGDGE